MHVYEPGEHGRGFVVRPGDRPTIPAGFLKLSLNPLKSSGHLTKAGIHMLAQTFFLSGLPRQEDGYIEFATSVEKEMDTIASAFLTGKGLDLNDPNHSDQIASVMQEDQTSKEYWAFSAGLFLNLAREAVGQGDARRAAWAAA